MRCLHEHSLHQEDVQVHLLESHSDKVRVVLVELRLIPRWSSLSIILRSTSRDPLSLTNRLVLFVLDWWTSCLCLVSGLTKRSAVLWSFLLLGRFSLSLRALAFLRLRVSQPVGGRSRLPHTWASLIVMRKATAIPTILLLLSSVVKATSSHFLIGIARRYSFRTRIDASSHHAWESTSASVNSTINGPGSPKLCLLLQMFTILLIMRRDSALWSCCCHHHLGRMLHRSLIVAGLIATALVERVVVVATEPWRWRVHHGSSSAVVICLWMHAEKF